MGHQGLFTGDRDGITAVVATILLVAIVVGLAAGIFVILQIIASERADSAPAIGFTKDEAADRLVVVSAVEGADWDRLQVQASMQGGTANEIRIGNDPSPFMNEAATSSGALVLNQRADVSSDSRKIVGNDFVAFCADGTAMGVAVSIFDVQANARVGTWNFQSIETICS